MEARKIELLAAQAVEYSLKASKIESLLKKRAELLKTIDDIAFLKSNAGRMVFTGQSGKVGEDHNLREVYINGIAGCVAVPTLLLSLANNALDGVELDMELLVSN